MYCPFITSDERGTNKKTCDALARKAETVELLNHYATDVKVNLGDVSGFAGAAP